MDREYHLKTDNGIPGLYRCTYQRISDVDAVLGDAATKIGQLTPNCFMVREQPVTVYAKKAYTLLLTSLPTLSLRTTFQIDAGDLVPHFQPPTHRDRPVAKECVWTPPATMRLHFVVKCDESRPTQALLFATHTNPNESQGGFWRLPLANVYTDGRLCLGELFERQRPAKSLATTLENTLAILDRSDWNTDLIPEELSKNKRLFRFDPVAGLSRAFSGDWTECCFQVSNPLMREVIP